MDDIAGTSKANDRPISLEFLPPPPDTPPPDLPPIVEEVVLEKENDSVTKPCTYLSDKLRNLPNLEIWNKQGEIQGMK